MRVVVPSAPCRPTRTTGCQDRQPTYLQQFGLYLKLLRVKRGLTQEQVAERAGMHRTFIGLLERGESGISVDRLPDRPRRSVSSPLS